MRMPFGTRTLLASLAVLGLAAPAQAELLFEDQGTGKLGTQACNGSGCWSNYARVTDFNGDGTLDLVVVNCSGFFSNPGAQPLVFYANDGAGNFTNATATINFTAAVRQVAFGDVDGDGDLDFYAPAAGSAQLDALFIHEPGSFDNQASTRLPAGLSSDAGATRFGDFDNDGDLDLLVADGYIVDNAPPAKLYLNDGTGVFSLAPPGSLPSQKNGLNPDDIDLADVDGDFDLDILINMHNGSNSLWKNNGDGTFVDASVSLAPLGTGSQFHYGPVFCDIDGDGDRDLIVDNTGGGYSEQILVNDGNGTFSDQTSTRISGNGGADDNLVSCIDADGDGDFDLVVGSLSSNERLFKNNGAGVFTPEPGAFSSVNDPTLWMEFGDLNGDGRLDALTAQGEGSPQLERIYFGNAAVPVDVIPPRIIGLENVTPSASSETAVRFAVSDNAITDEGPRLREAFVLLGGLKIPARFSGGDIYRAVLPVSSETSFTVCAEDLAGNLTPGCGGPDTTSASTGNGATSSGSGGAGTSASTGSGATGAASGGAGAGGGDGVAGGDDGCGCRAGAEHETSGSALLLGLLGLLGLARRRRS